MTKPTRREFLAGAAALGVGAAASVSATGSPSSSALPQVVHQVYFWLKNPESEQDRQALIVGLKTLKGIDTVKGIQIGVPASTEKRAVVDNSFQVSEMLLFDNVEGQNVYQEHPIHKQFVKDCEHLWRKVVVYDSIAV